jgi:uncharacterized membrane protein YfcA
MPLPADKFIPHVVVGLVVSFGLSTAFWIALGVFNLAGFLIWSTVIGLIGAAVGTWFKSRIVNVIATAVIRLIHFVVMTYVIAQ